MPFYQGYLQLVQQGQLYKVCIVVVLMLILNVLNKLSFCWLITDSGFYISMFYFLTFTMEIFARKWYDSYNYSLEYAFGNKTKYYEKYLNLDYLSRQELNVHDFHRNTSNAINSITTVLSWGVPTIMSLICNIIVMVWLFYTNDLMNVLTGIFAINIVYYILKLHKAQQLYIKYVSKNRKLDDNDFSQINIFLELLVIDNIFSTLIVEKDMSINARNMRERINCDNNVNYIKIVNLIPLFIIVFVLNCTTQTTITMIINYGQFLSTYECLLVFLKRYVEIDAQYKIYEKMWNDKKFIEPCEQLDIPDIFNIEKIDINIGNCHIGGENIKISKSDKSLIVGESGSGKTTFTLALTGLIDGVYLGENSPKNYTNKSVRFIQDLSGSLDLNTSIRKLFTTKNPNGSTRHDDDLIIRCLKICNILERAKKIDPNESGIEFLDMNINNSFSGGEKSRLVIALTAYHAKVYDKKIIILDEPEKGINSGMACEIIKNIMTEFDDCLLIVISHLEQIEIKFQWNNVLCVKDSIISQI